MFSTIAALISALAAGGIAIYNNYRQKKLNEQLTGSQREQNQFNAIQAGIQRDFTAAEAQKSRDFTEYMARNKYGIETASMKDAGVNPALVYGGGNLVPTAANGATGAGAATQGQGSGNAGIADLTSLVPSLMAAIRLPLEMQQMKAELKKTEVETEGMSLQNYITDSTKDAIIKTTNLEPEQKQAEIDKILAETKSEDIRAQVLGVDLLQRKLDYDQSKRMNELVFEMQKMQNEYQDFVNKHQERQWKAEYNKICAEVNELYTRAKKNMSDIELNNSQRALNSALQSEAGARTTLLGQQTKTEEARTMHEKVSIWKDYNDPKAHLTRSIVDPMDKLHNFLTEGPRGVGQAFQGFWNDTKDQYRRGYDEGPYGKHNRASHKDYLEEQAEAIATMYATFGQAVEEYGGE